jgi:hypothetical protein
VAATGSRETGNRGKAVPQSDGASASGKRVPGQPAHGIRTAEERVARRHEVVSFGEQQEQDAIDDGERLFEGGRQTFRLR